MTIDTARRERRARGAPYATDAAGPTPFELVSSIAHELRTPLSALTASAEMLQGAGAAERPRFAAIIQRQAERLNGIVEGLLEAYRACSGELRCVRDVVDMDEFLSAVCAEQELLYPRHRFALEAEPGRQVSADRRLLAIIVGNLVSNAAKYSPAGSTVRIVCRREGAALRIRVRDEGAGVPGVARRRIFEAGDRGGRSDELGFGLGLFIVRMLCDAIGAAVELEDARDGEGACFAVVLPCRGVVRR